MFHVSPLEEKIKHIFIFFSYFYIVEIVFLINVIITRLLCIYFLLFFNWMQFCKIQEICSCIHTSKHTVQVPNVSKQLASKDYEVKLCRNTVYFIVFTLMYFLIDCVNMLNVMRNICYNHRNVSACHSPPHIPNNNNKKQLQELCLLWHYTIVIFKLWTGVCNLMSMNF